MVSVSTSVCIYYVMLKITLNRGRRCGLKLLAENIKQDKLHDCKQKWQDNEYFDGKLDTFSSVSRFICNISQNSLVYGVELYLFFNWQCKLQKYKRHLKVRLSAIFRNLLAPFLAFLLHIMIYSCIILIYSHLDVTICDISSF